MTQHTLPIHKRAAHSTSADALAILIGRSGPFVALLAASVATAGSLFMSDVLGWVPCTLCWYQRILMYPLAIILFVGLLRRERKLYQYVLPFSFGGAVVSTYHYLLQKTDWFPPPPCAAGVPCTVDYINLLGFVTVPFLALVAFLLVGVSSLLETLVEDETSDGSRTHGVVARVGWDRVVAVAVAAAVVVTYRVAASLIF